MTATTATTAEQSQQPQPHSHSHVKQLLNIDEVRAMTGFSTTTIYKYVKAGVFPAPKNCGGRAVRWRLADIEDYINS